MYQNRIKHLEKLHEELDKKIDSMEKTGVYEDEHLHELKKLRLLYKDQIQKLRDEHKND